MRGRRGREEGEEKGGEGTGAVASWRQVRTAALSAEVLQLQQVCRGQGRERGRERVGGVEEGGGGQGDRKDNDSHPRNRPSLLPSFRA